MAFAAKKWWYLLILVLVLPVINIAVYVTVAGYLGGDAINGRVDDGRYFLGSHGKYTEVSRAVFDYSRIHTYTVWATCALLVLAMLVVLFLKFIAFFLSRKGFIRR